MASFTAMTAPRLNAPTARKEWWRDGMRHRDDGPAIEYANGPKEWWRDGKRHPEDGPAIEWSDLKQSWFWDGKKLSKTDFLGLRQAVQESRGENQAKAMSEGTDRKIGHPPATSFPAITVLNDSAFAALHNL